LSFAHAGVLVPSGSLPPWVSAWTGVPSRKYNITRGSLGFDVLAEIKIEWSTPGREFQVVESQIRASGVRVGPPSVACGVCRLNELEICGLDDFANTT